MIKMVLKTFTFVKTSFVIIQRICRVHIHSSVKKILINLIYRVFHCPFVEHLGKSYVNFVTTFVLPGHDHTFTYVHYIYTFKLIISFS